MASVLRPLSPVERTLWRLSAGASLNITTVAHIRGPLDLSAIGRGLVVAQGRHPLLRATIESSDRAQPVFVADAAGPLRARLGSDDWRVEVERELVAPMDARIGPLARAVWVPEAGGGRLLLTLNHAIADPRSGVIALRDALMAIALQSGQRGRALVPVEDVPAVEDGLAARGRGLLGALAATGERIVQAVQNFTIGRPVSLPEDQPVPCTERRIRFIPVEIDPDITAALTARARKEGATVNSALLAAASLGVAGNIGRKQPHGLAVTVDLRPSLDPAPDETVGMYGSLMLFRKKVGPNDSFWELARSIRHFVHDGQDRLRPHSTINTLPVTFQACGGHKREPADLALTWESKTHITTGLTNLGKLAIETDFGPFSVRSYQVAINPSAMGSYVCTATCTRGQIDWNFMFGDPTFEKDHAESVVSATLDRLLGALDE